MDHNTQQYETSAHHVAGAVQQASAQHVSHVSAQPPVVSAATLTSLHQQQPVTPTYHVQVASNAAASATHHRTHAYKRPMPPTPRKFIGTTAAAVYSPRSTPPCKIPALQRVYTKNGHVIVDLSGAGEGPIAAPLTPPPTPEVSGL